MIPSTSVARPRTNLWAADVTYPDPIDGPRALEQIVSRAEAAGVSDIHLQTTGAGLEIAFRLDGVMQPAGSLPGGVGSRVLGRVKYLAKLKTYQDQFPQDGRIERRDLGSASDVRVSTYPTVTGEKIVLRLFREAETPDLENMGFDASSLSAMSRFLAQPTGLMLLTGPAGSGKTTTIYACLKHLGRKPGRHVITVEDPVEQVLPGVMQTEINEARGLTFAEAVRHLLRQDPQVLAIGEIRDDATAQLAVRAALTGHLVLSTLHAGSCRGVLERLLAMSPDAMSIASALGLVVNQRLLRKSCGTCAGAGCPTCLGSGFRGRAPVVEFLSMNAEQQRNLGVRRLEGIDPVRFLAEAARELCAAGLTTSAECERVLGK